MPVPTDINSLSTTPSANSPVGSTDSPSVLDDHQRQAYAHIATLRDSVALKASIESVALKAPLTGDGTSGTWPISISGTATNATFVPAGTGAVATNVQSKLRESVSVKDFGDGVSSSAMNAAVLHVALAGGGRVLVPFGNYIWTTTIIIPSNVEIDLCNSNITGPGVGSATDLFQSGYLSGGTLVPNIGLPNETQLVTNASINNANISNCGKALNIFNWIDNCKISNIKFYNCTYAVYSSRSWYSRYVNLFSRGNAGGATNAAFYFDGYVNVQQIESVFVEGRSGIGIELAGGANGQVLFNCSTESCVTGIKVSGDTGPLKFDTCYLEDISGIGVDLNTAGYKHDIVFDNCWFNTCLTAINGANTGGGSTITVHENCRFVNCTSNFNCTDNYASFGKIDAEPAEIPNNGYPSLPSGYALGGRMRVEHDNIIYNSVSGLAAIKTKVHGTTLIAFEHEGNSGAPVGDTVPFCVHSKSAGTPFSIYIDTKITYQQHSSLLVYKLRLSDNLGNYELHGLIFGDQVKPLDSVGKTLVVSNNSGFVRLTLSTFSHPSEVYGCTGVVRHV